MPTTSPSCAGNGISTTVTGSVTPAAGPSTPTGVPHGYVVPASSFSYGVLPPPNSVSGSSQQSSNNPVLKLTPSVSAAALQPPVPGQSFGNRPSFSYNIVSQANVGSAIGQQFQPAIATNLSHLQGGKFTAAMTAASLQPPVPGQIMRPSSSVPGTSTPNLLPQIRMPFSISKGHAPTSTSYSFGGVSQPPMPAAPNVFANTSTSDSAVPEAGNSLATSVSSQSTQSSATLASSSAMHPVAGPSMNPSTVLMETASSFPVHSVTTGIAGTPGQLGMLNSMPFSPNGATVRTNMGSSPSLGSAVPSPIPAPSNPAPIPIPIAQNVQQQNYPPYASLPTVTPSPQAPWFHPPLHGGLPRAPFLPHLGVLPTFPQPNRGMPLPSVPSQTVQPPGVPSAVAHGGTIPFNLSSSDIGGNSGSALLHPEHERQGSEPSKGGVARNEEIDAWTAHKTETGTIYYYNCLTGKSTYEKPLNFKEKPEKANDQPNPVSWEKLDGTDWTLVTTNDGKKYYYDTKNKVSSWQLPVEVAELRRNQDSGPLKGNASPVQNVAVVSDKGSTPVSLNAPALQTGGRDSLVLRTSAAPVSSSALDLIKKKLQDAGTPVVASPLPASSGPSAADLNGSRVVEAAVKGAQSTTSKDKVKDPNGDDNVSDSLSDSDVESGPSKEECIIQFKEMLKERGIAPFSKWDKELPKIVFDPRFKAVPGYSTRRAVFEQFVRTRAEEVRKEERAAQKAAIDGFKQLLEEASEDIDHRTDYETFKKKWGNDPRFIVLKRKEQELLLNEKILPLKKAAEEKIQAIRMAATSSFKSMLRDRGDITPNSRWSRVKDSLRNDPRYKTVKHEDREILFNEYISELKSAEEEQEQAAKAKKDEQEKLKERERELRKRKEREEQEMERVKLKIRKKEAVASYQALLVETIKDPKASWTESKPKLDKDPQGRAINPELGQTDAEKLFREHVKDLYERCVREFRNLLAEVITPEAAITQTTEGKKTVLNSWSEAKQVMKPDPRYSKMPRKDRESLWSQYTEDILRKQKTATSDQKKPDAEGRSRTAAVTILEGHMAGGSFRRVLFIPNIVPRT
ncbi:hypothetical protein J5N97_021877 [Dioscorea zingiberensis]|uniref:Pre-mRNA-processing protein 40C n=1 Tax=Dioscorea zingiberensis TaxID=325984 RepID=A0A9D5HAC1_9LILI|nr:hypothetical protein J5N97_021877 [Dioscorea zingiberensis]